MPAVRHPSRVDTLELKVRIGKKLGPEKAEKYFNLVSRYLNFKLSKADFSRVCVGLIGRENICLHNEFLRAILKNACTAKTPPPKHSKSDGPVNANVPNGCVKKGPQSVCSDGLPQSIRKGRALNIHERKFGDRPSPLGLHEKARTVAFDESAKKVQEQQSATELLSLGSKPPVEVNSVEDGEEVDQTAISPGINSRIPVRAPFGISIHSKETRKVLHNSSSSAFVETCHYCGELPDTSLLHNRLKQNLVMEGLDISRDCVNMLNNGLDAYLKRLIKPCLALADSRSEHKLMNQVIMAPFGSNGMMRCVQKPVRDFSASMLDFRVAAESNPKLLGEDWPVQLEKVSLLASEIDQN